MVEEALSIHSIASCYLRSKRYCRDMSFLIDFQMLNATALNSMFKNRSVIGNKTAHNYRKRNMKSDVN